MADKAGIQLKRSSKRRSSTAPKRSSEASVGTTPRLVWTPDAPSSPRSSRASASKRLARRPPSAGRRNLLPPGLSRPPENDGARPYEGLYAPAGRDRRNAVAADRIVARDDSLTVRDTPPKRGRLRARGGDLSRLSGRARPAAALQVLQLPAPLFDGSGRVASRKKPST